MLDVKAGDILLLAYAMNGNFVDMISVYGDLGQWTNADEYAYEMYSKFLADNGAADPMTVRASIVSVIVSSGTGRFQGEGVTGLPYALSIAGNRSTVLSLWPVADDSTKTFMLILFTKIRDGMNFRKALSDTKREFLQLPRFSAPIFWAPFVAYGS